MKEQNRTNNQNRKIANMHYYYNKQYFDGIQKIDKKYTINNSDDNFIKRNNNILGYSFPLKTLCQYTELNDLAGFKSFELTTLYPGLLMGIGYTHDLATDEGFKLGFSFDYVTGVPYLPGSSLKGILKSYFPKGDSPKEQEKLEYIQSLLQEKDVKIDELVNNIFDNGDVFLDVYPSEKNIDTKIILDEYITSHTSGIFKNPVPVKLVKVKPNTIIKFMFLLNDYVVDGKVIFSADEKAELFKKIILDMGIGAKTNVGYGQLGEFQNGRIPFAGDKKNIKIEGVCKDCGKPTKKDKNGIYFKYCGICANKHKSY